LNKEQAIALARARRRKAEATQASVPPVTRGTPAQPTPVARELATQPVGARQQYSREMAAQAFGDRPTSDEYLQAGLFGTTPLRPSQLQGQVDLRQSEPGLSPAFTPELLTGLAGRAAVGVGRSVLKKRTKTARDFYDDLTTPYMSRKEQIARELRGTDSTVMGTHIFRPSSTQKAQKDILKTVKGIKPSNNLRQNINVMNNEVITSSRRLKGRLAKSKAVITDSEVEGAVRSQIAKYKNTLEGIELEGQEEIIDAAVRRVMEAYNKHPKTPAGLWEARKEIDNAFRALNGERRYAQAVGQGGMIPSKAEIMWDNSRKAMLELMEKKVPGSKSEMRRLSIMYDARQTMAEKAPDVGKTLYQRGKKAVGLGEKSIQLKPRNWRQ